MIYADCHPFSIVAEKARQMVCPCGLTADRFVPSAEDLVSYVSHEKADPLEAMKHVIVAHFRNHKAQCAIAHPEWPEWMGNPYEVLPD